MAGSADAASKAAVSATLPIEQCVAKEGANAVKTAIAD